MTQPIQVTLGGVRWLLPPQYRPVLLGADGLRLPQWLEGGQAQVIKHGPHRTVYRVALDGLTFYLKHYPLPDARAWLRQLVRPAKARREYDRALAVAARQVPTFVPLALGEPCGRLAPGESFLLTHSLDGAEPVSSFLERTLPRFACRRQTHVRQRVAAELGRLVGRLHEAGILHHDLHAANILVRLEDDDLPRLYLIDLHAVRLGETVGWRASRDNLVMLNRWFTLRASRTDRLRFWHAYYETRGDEVGTRWRAAVLGTITAGQPHRLTRGGLARDLEQRTWASNLAFWRHRDRRCQRENRYFRRVHGAAASGHATTDLDGAALAALAADPDEPFRRPGVKLLKDSRSSTVAELELPVGGVPRRVIYKRFRVTAWSDPWVNLLRRPPALRSWVHGHGLRERWLATPRPLAVLCRRRHGLYQEGYLLTEKVEGAVDVHQYLADLAPLPRRERLALLRSRIDQVARLVHELHRRQLSHRDLKAANILVSVVRGPLSVGEGSGAVPTDHGPRTTDHGQIWLIDLVGVESFGKLPRSRKVQNLARLNASFHQSRALTRTDRLRFLRAYLRWGLHGRGDWKRWWRDIEQATQAKVARNLRRGRPLA